LPDSGTGDIQLAAEYVVRAIRTMSARAGDRRIDIVGHSQGGMIGRWALKYWPDTRRKVDDFVGLASSNHGTIDFQLVCPNPMGCPAAIWQQRGNSRFLDALNSGPETWPGISYTQVATRYDEILVPYTSTYLAVPSGSRSVVNTTVQDLCPTEVTDHFGMTYSNAAWLVGLDALTHRGPARLARISRATCSQGLMPGVDPTVFATDLAKAVLQAALSLAATPRLSAEPPLRRYAR
jgi:triacylglycerol esterase/lipase EstA (alpha/beta hydrolase family)